MGTKYSMPSRFDFGDITFFLNMKRHFFSAWAVIINGVFVKDDCHFGTNPEEIPNTFYASVMCSAIIPLPRISNTFHPSLRLPNLSRFYLKRALFIFILFILNVHFSMIDKRLVEKVFWRIF